MGGQVGGLPPVRTVLRVRVVVLGRRVEGRARWQGTVQHRRGVNICTEVYLHSCAHKDVMVTYTACLLNVGLHERRALCCLFNTVVGCVGCCTDISC